MNGIFRTPPCTDQPSRRAMSIKASQRAALDARNFNTEGVAREMGLDPATLRRYLSDCYKGCMPVDQIHSWFIATDGDLSPVRQQLHLCGMDIVPLYQPLDPSSDSPRLAAEVSHEAGDLVGMLLEQWSDGIRNEAERRKALPLMVHLRAKLDQLITIDESRVGGQPCS